MTASGDEIVLQSTDLEISIKATAKANVASEGAAVIPGRLISDIVRSLPEAAVTLDATERDAMKVTCGQSSFDMKTLSPDDFPKFPEVKASESVTIPTDTLVALVRQVSKAVSRDETRPVLTGVLLVVDAGSIRMVATDSYRLAIKEMPIENAPADRIEVVVPGRAIEEIPKMAGSIESVTMGVAENQVIFEFGSTVYVSRRIEGTYPNYKQLIPKEAETTVTANREELLEAVKRVSLMAQHNAPVRLAITESTLTLSARTQDVGEAKEDLMVKTEGADVEIAFNHAFLLDGVAAAGDEELRFEATSPLKPGVFRSPDGSYTYLVMPVRLS
jgi:DNA polymerase III subunit beta